MIRQHQQLNGHESELTLGNRGQGSLEYYTSWGCKELHMTEQLDNRCKSAECPTYRLTLKLHDVVSSASHDLLAQGQPLRNIFDEVINLFNLLDGQDHKIINQYIFLTYEINNLFE